MSEQFKVVEYVLSLSSNQPLHNLQDTCETPLLIACQGKFHAIAKIILEHSPKLLFAIEAQENLSPLHLASLMNDTIMVELLLQAFKVYIDSLDCDSETKISLDFRDKKNQTPLYNACYHGYFDVVKQLVNFQGENNQRVTLNVNAAIKNSKRTPLHAAVHKGSYEVTQLLLTIKDIDVDVEGYPSEETWSKIIENYLKQRSSKHPGIESATSKFRIFEAPKTGEFHVKKSQDSLPPAQDFNKLLVTPLVEACACSHIDIAALLLLHGAQDNRGLACRIAHLIQQPELIKLILSHHVVLKNSPVKSLELRWNGHSVWGTGWGQRQSFMLQTIANIGEL